MPDTRTDTSTDRYRADFSEGDLWRKLGSFARVAGREVVERALLLYLVLRDKDTPRWARGTVIGALGYFIAPIDAIPDFIPGAGFTDDLGVLAMAITAVAASITPEMQRVARRTAARWFGETPAPADGGQVIEAEATVVGREQTI
jgi:uncharacterized membrane protein YkvA (DUF1232 family)